MESKVDDNWFTIEQIDRDTFSISEVPFLDDGW